MRWEKIPKDRYGFFGEDSGLYDQLPIIVAEVYDDGAQFVHYVDKDNWGDTVSDLSRSRFKYYIRVEPLE